MLRRPTSEMAPAQMAGSPGDWLPTLSERAVRTHRQLAAALNVAAGALYLLIAFGIFLFFLMAGGVVAADGKLGAAGVVGIFGTAITIFFAVLALPSIIGGWALYVEKSWAKPLLLVLSALHLPNFPFGTALGVYTIWVVLSTEPVVPAVPPPYPKSAL